MTSDAQSHFSSSEVTADNIPSQRTDVLVSIVLVVLSVLVGGYGLFLSTESWRGIPIIVVGILMWGMSCMGLRRLLSRRP